tara:strand:- start:205 stop:624 length:420 start_codon:yes stop_codon:yes gene_type:complete
MSHHIISGKDSSTGRAAPFIIKEQNLKVDTGFPETINIHLLNNVSIAAGQTLTTSAFNFKKRSKILIFGTLSLDNVNIGFEISPQDSNPTNFYETFENINVITGSVYSFVNLYTDYFRLKITNNEASAVTINLFGTSKN